MAADHVIADTASNERDRTGPLAALGTATGLAAVAASSCCVLPLALAGLGAGSAVFGGLELLANYQAYILGAAGALLAGAWVTFWRNYHAKACAGDVACARRGTTLRTIIALAVATKVVAIAAAWSFIDPVLARAIQ